MMLKFVSTLFLLTGFIKAITCIVGGYNVAFQKSTYQSSTYLYYHSSRAVSNITSTNLVNGGCSHTQSTSITWWSVDLGEILPVVSVIITRRQIPRAHTRRLSNFEIYGSNKTYFLPNDTGAQLCKPHYQPVVPGGTVQLNCTSEPLYARYIIIWKNMTHPKFSEDSYYLCLCNVEVIRECPYGRYGESCSKQCSNNCKSSSTCNRIAGQCPGFKCKAGYHGQRCTEECRNGTYGDRCRSRCSQNCLNSCNKFTNDGTCFDEKCKPGYIHDGNCTKACPDGKYGENCTHNCSSNCVDPVCEKQSQTGICKGGCKPGFTGENCTECVSGRYGVNCKGQCNCKNNKTCDKVDGFCSNGCDIGYYGLNCSQDCVTGRFGYLCIEYCHCKDNVPCNTKTGYCSGGCATGYIGFSCVTPCVDGMYGENCSSVCSTNCANPVCHKHSLNGDCIGGCKEGFTGVNCSAIASKNNISVTVGGVLVAAAFIICVVTFLIWRMKSKRVKRNQTDFGLEMVGDMKTLFSVSEFITKIKKHPFKEEYQNLPNALHPWDIAESQNLQVKNKYRNIYPYNHNIVPLQKIGDDELSTYINASFIKDYYEEVSYIAAQGVTQFTLDDFWRMIWEQKLQLIVMVTNTVEDKMIKCEQYWPSEGLEMYGDINVLITEEVVYHSYTLRMIKVTKNSESRLIRHYQYTDWPEEAVPENLSALCKIREIIKGSRLQKETPVLIHCSNGVGRTGTVIALDILLEQADVEQQVDIYGCLEKMRKQRTNMVDTLVQYVFLYDALAELFSVGSSLIPCSNLVSFLNSEEGKKKLVEQYDILQRIKSNSDDHEHKEKNKGMNVAPSEYDRREPLSSPGALCNAVYVKGYKKRSVYIATQIPPPSRVDQFWKMVFECKCTTLVCLETDPECQSWFNPNMSPVTFGEYTALVTNTSNSDVITKYDVTLGRHMESCYVNVNVGTTFSPNECFNMSPEYTALVTRISDSDVISKHTESDYINAGISSSPNECFNMSAMTSGEYTSLVTKASNSDIVTKHDVTPEKHKEGSQNNESTTSNPSEENLELELFIIKSFIINSLSDFVTAVREIHKKQHKNGQCVVMCRNGATKSGVYIAFSWLLNMIEIENEVDVFHVVKQLRKKRPQFICSLEQYQWLYRLLQEALQETDIYQVV